MKVFNYLVAGIIAIGLTGFSPQYVLAADPTIADSDFPKVGDDIPIYDDFELQEFDPEDEKDACGRRQRVRMPRCAPWNVNHHSGNKHTVLINNRCNYDVVAKIDLANCGDKRPTIVAKTRRRIPTGTCRPRVVRCCPNYSRCK